MVAPNGARRTKGDHPALPMTISEIVADAKACRAAGAAGLHAHVRDGDGRHVLDAGLYRELLHEMAQQVPDMACQITTEAVGRYSPSQQRDLVNAVTPAMVSVALREMLSEGLTSEVRDFYGDAHDRAIAVQHILYSPVDVNWLGKLVESGEIPGEFLQILYVLGRHSASSVSDPADLDAFLQAGAAQSGVADWAVCAFGITETQILRRVRTLGGKVRVGFENNLHNADGEIARDNAERVASVLVD